MALIQPSSLFHPPASGSRRIVRIAGLTDRGLKRSRNEDAFLAAPELGLMAVADGMGGHANGDVASQLTIDTLSTFFRRVVRWEGPPVDAETSAEHGLTTAIRLANWRLFYGAQPGPPHGPGRKPPRNGVEMGTTVVAALFGDCARGVAIAHVGDSRAYRMRRGLLERLTRDHSVREEAAHLASLGEDVAPKLPQNVLTRAVGAEAEVDVELCHHATEAGDTFLLCSDGLWTRALEAEIASVLERARTLDIACRALVALANQHGGGDNITVTLARVDDIAPPPRSGTTR